MADKANNRRWMRRGATAWFYNGAKQKVPELVTLIRREGRYWRVADKLGPFYTEVEALFRAEILAYRAYRESAYRGYAAAKRRLEEIDAHIAKLEANDG